MNEFLKMATNGETKPTNNSTLYRFYRKYPEFKEKIIEINKNWNNSR